MAATFERASVSAQLAKVMIEAAEKKATEMGHPFVIAIVDDSGVLKAFSRMDGAPLLSVQVAQDKAYTAVGFGMATDAWYDFIKDDPPLAMGAGTGIDRLVVFGGGHLIWWAMSLRLMLFATASACSSLAEWLRTMNIWVRCVLGRRRNSAP